MRWCLPTQGISQASNLNLQVVSHSVNAPVTQLDVIALELNYHHQAIPGNTRFKTKFISPRLSRTGISAVSSTLGGKCHINRFAKTFKLSLSFYIKLVMHESTSLKQNSTGVCLNPERQQSTSFTCCSTEILYNFDRFSGTRLPISSKLSFLPVRRASCR